MADEDGANVSVKDRIARLQANSNTRPPKPTSVSQQRSHTNPVNGYAHAPPAVSRASTLSHAPEAVNYSSNNNHAFGMDGISRPALPPRTSTQSSQRSLASPPLPPRQNSSGTLSPMLPPRRPSDTSSQCDYMLTRRPSNESINSIGTSRSSISTHSVATSTFSQSERRTVRAPAYDPNNLPALPPKRTEAQKDAYYRSGSKQFSRAPLKSSRPTAGSPAPRSVTSPPSLAAMPSPPLESSSSMLNEHLAVSPRGSAAPTSMQPPDLSALQISKPKFER